MLPRIVTLAAPTIRFEVDSVAPGEELTVEAITTVTARYDTLIVETCEGFELSELLVDDEPQFGAGGSSIPATTFAPDRRPIRLALGHGTEIGIFEGMRVGLVLRNVGEVAAPFRAILLRGPQTTGR